MKRVLPAVMGALAVGAIVLGIALQRHAGPGHRDVVRAPFELSELQGKIGLVNVWATWCAPCRREIPALLEIAAQYEPRGVHFVAVNADDADRVTVDTFVKGQPAALEKYLAYPAAGFLDGMHLEALPTTLIVDRQGNELKRFVGEVDPAKVRAALDEVLAH